MIIHLKKNHDPTIFVDRAAEMIREGMVVGYPIDGSYGLGVDPMNPLAIQNLIDKSGACPEDHFFVLVPDIEEAQKIGVLNDAEIKIAEKFWPGNIMLVVPLKKSNDQWKMITGGKNTITIGIPNHPIALAMLNSLKDQNQLGAVLCISASDPDENPISDGKQMAELYGMTIDFLIEFGNCSRGQPPTIIELDHKSELNLNMLKKSINILREGKISKQEILEVFQTHE